MDARGQTATGCQEVYLAASHRATTCRFFAPFPNALLCISAESPTCLKVLQEVRARGKERRISQGYSSRRSHMGFTSAGTGSYSNKHLGHSVA